MKRRRVGSTGRKRRRGPAVTERGTPGGQDASAPSFPQQLLHYEAANGWPTPDIAALILVPLYVVARFAGFVVRFGRAVVSRPLQRR